MAIRGKSFGKLWIQELGDLIAHPFEKDRGLSVLFANNLALSHAAFHALAHDRAKYDLLIPNCFAELCRARLNLYRNGNLLTEVALSFKQAQKAIEKAAKQIKSGPDLNDLNLSTREYDLVKILLTSQRAPQIIDINSLHSDFLEVLIKNNRLGDLKRGEQER